jgi:hypothetical protein
MHNCAMINLNSTSTNLQAITREDTRTYNEDFFIVSFFTWSVLGAGVIPKVLMDVKTPAEGDVYPGAALGSTMTKC